MANTKGLTMIGRLNKICKSSNKYIDRLMKQNLVIIAVLLTLHCVSIHTASELDSIKVTNQLVVMPNDDGTSFLRIVCEAWVGVCSFNYILLPPGWFAQGNLLVVPSQEISSVRSFALRANISEPTGDYMVLNIVIDFQFGKTTLKSTIVQTSQNPFSSPQTSSSSSSPSRQSQVSAPTQTQTPKPQPAGNPLSPTNNFGQSFLEANNIIPSRVPISRLDAIIVSADIFEISSTVQDIVSYKQSCSTKLAYLNQVVSRIEEHIRINKQYLQEEQDKMMKSQSELGNLQQERERLINQLESLKEKVVLEKEIKELQLIQIQNNSKFFSSNIVANRYFARFKELLGNSAVSPTQLIQVRAEIEEDRKQLAEVDQKMLELRIMKAALETRIQNNQKKVKDTEANPGQSQADPQRLKSLEDKYKEFSQLAQTYKQKQNQAISKLQIARNKLSRISGTYDDIEQRLQEVNDKLQKAKVQMESPLIKNAENRVQTLQRNLPKLRAQVTKCESEVNTNRISIQPASIAYVERPQALANSQLGISPSLRTTSSPIQSPSIASTTVAQTPSSSVSEIQRLRLKQSKKTAINIYSSNWIMQYGVARTFSFVCASSSGLISGYGIVISIIGGQIRVQDPNGNIYSLHIGVCSKLLGSNSSTAPKIGDVIDWNGKPLTSNIYNIYRAVFYSMS